jgi:transposase
MPWRRAHLPGRQRRASGQGSPRRSALGAHEEFLLGLLDGQVDITLDEMRARLEDERGVRAARTTIWRFFARRGFTVKKRPGMRASSSAPTSRRRGSPGLPASRSSTRSG